MVRDSGVDIVRARSMAASSMVSVPLSASSGSRSTLMSGSMPCSVERILAS